MNNLKECRICFNNDKDDEYIAPCLCSGTSKYVHRDCINRWRVLSNNPEALTHCNQCNNNFQHMPLHLL